MTEQAPTASPLAADLAALQARGAADIDPMRWRFLTALAARLPHQPEAVQARLMQRLQAELQRLQAHAAEAAPSPATTAPPLSLNQASLLQQLNRYAAMQTQAALDATPSGEDARRSDMKSVRRFSETWSKLATQQRLSRALAKAPQAAGPLNSHNLMLRALSLMQRLSPDYVRRFLHQADALLWLDQMNQLHTLKPGKDAKDTKAIRRPRARK